MGRAGGAGMQVQRRGGGRRQAVRGGSRAELGCEVLRGAPASEDETDGHDDEERSAGAGRSVARRLRELGGGHRLTPAGR